MTSSSPKILLNREKARLGRFDLVLGLSRSVSSTQLDTLKAKFARSGFDYHLVSDPKVAPQHLLFLAYNNVIGILKAAGRLNIYKKAYTQHLIESKFKLRRVLTEKENKHLDPQIKELEETAKFTFARRKNFLFTPETVQAADKASNQPIVSKGEQCAQTGELHVERSESGSLRARLEEKGEYTEDEPFDAYIGLFTPSELCMIISSILNTLDVETADQSFYEVFNVKDIGELRSVSTRLIDHLKRLEVLEFLTPLHNSNISVGLESINNLTDYFGQNVGIYFKFMEHYTKWLIPPAVFGILVFLFSSENHPHFTFALESLYVIMIMIWATLFVEFWQRRSSEICVKWHTYTKQFSAFDSRFDFKGKTRINLVTGMPELYFPLRQKLIRYTKSILAHLPVMLFSFFLMIVFLNAKGYVLPHNKIYMPSLAALSHEGGLFDKKTTWKLIPSILQVTCMVLLARVNKALSFVTTRWENHQTQTGYNNSIIGKRFLFEVLITFLHLFYIVFFRFDFDMLKAELIILFATDEVRRLAMETLVPYVKTKFLGDKKAKTEAEKKNDSKTQETLDQYIEDKVKEINMQDYDEFDDYLEMIVQFGYITLFAAAFPLSGALSLVFNGSEVLSDYYKLGNLYRRPMPINVNGIGTWKNALDIMSYLCIVSNCVIMGTSPSLRSLLSLEAKGSAQAFEEVKDDMGINLLVLEHVVLIVAYLLKTLLRGEPFWVRIYLRRKAHLGSN